MCADLTSKQQLRGNLSISNEELKSKINSSEEPFMIFDIGDQERYAREHIPGSKHAVCDEKTINTLIPKLPKEVDIILVGEDEKYIKEMSELGRNKGNLQTRYLQGGYHVWNGKKTRETDPMITANNLKQLLDKNYEDYFLLDVREIDEFKTWNIEGSKNIPLGRVPDALDEIPKDKKIITICPHGNRSGMITSMLQRLGYDAITLEGGLKSWSSAYESVKENFSYDGKRNNIIQVRRIGKGCLSYIIKSEGECAVLDPTVPVDAYVDIAENELNSRITKVFDTHLHADHVSGAKELAIKTKSTLFVSAYEDYSTDKLDSQSIDIEIISDGFTTKIGNLHIKAIYTPGHTDGALSYIVDDKLVFVGDTVLVSSIGRPDLKDKAEENAALLFNTLHRKILTLEESVIILPAHIDRTVRSDIMVKTSISDVKKTNSKLLSLDESQFKKKISSATSDTPPSYKQILSINEWKTPRPHNSEILDMEMGPNKCSLG